MSVRKPQDGIREPADLRLMGVGARPESDPRLWSSSLAQRGQQRLGAAGDVAHYLRVDGAIEAHGFRGRAGDGESAATLQDDLGRPIQAFNFTEGSRPKCGDTDRDIYRIFMTGLDGTPMPSFADNIKPDEAWDLVFYLRALMSGKSKEREMAKQLALKPVDPNAPAGQQ